MIKNIVFLGPARSTFSYIAYEKLSSFFKIPKFTDISAKLTSVSSNDSVLTTLIERGGYGVIAMETKSGGKVVEPLESFIDLLGMQATSSVQVIGAIKMKLQFALLARSDMKKEDIRKIVAHPKAFEPCKKNIARLGIETEIANSNGAAAEAVATRSEYAFAAALAPACAAKNFCLSVLDEHFEDGEAITTFFLLAAGKRAPVVLKDNRALIVFHVSHATGSLVDALMPFKEYGLNLIHIHSAYAGEGQYAFAIELELRHDAIRNFYRAIEKLKHAVSHCLVFGPFGIIER